MALSMRTQVVYRKSQRTTSKTKERIKAREGGVNGSKEVFIPTTNRSNNNNGSATNFVKPLNRILGFLNGGNITKLAPKTAGLIIAQIACKVVDKGIENYLTFQSGYSGNYTLSHNYHNFKTGLGILTNPISARQNYEKVKMNTVIDHQQKEQERILLGANTRGV